MARTKAPQVAELATDDLESLDEYQRDPGAVEVEHHDPIIAIPSTKRARIKGTWTQYYGTLRYDFVDGHSYDLPLDLFEYLKSRSCIYDTL